MSKIKFIQKSKDKVSGEVYKVGFETDLGEKRNILAVQNKRAVWSDYEDSEEGTKGISTRKTPEEADKEIKKLNKKLSK